MERGSFLVQGGSGTLWISMGMEIMGLMGEGMGKEGGKTLVFWGVEAAVGRLQTCSVIEPGWVALLLEKSSLLRRLDLSSAPCLAPWLPRCSPASRRLTSRCMSDRQVVGWCRDRVAARAWGGSNHWFSTGALEKV